MKYIRTKEGQLLDMSKCLDSRPTQYGLLRFAKSYFNDKQITISIKNIIKEADTIEELCDEFVAMCDEYKKPFAWSNHHKDYFKEVKQFYDYWGKKDDKHLQFLYGAIWTDKGLIYVAKMNEKGELELL